MLGSRCFICLTHGMLGLSYGKLFLFLGAIIALIGPKDLPIIARTAGRLAGRAIGYVQMARGQFNSVLQQSQASQILALLSSQDMSSPKPCFDAAFWI